MATTIIDRLGTTISSTLAHLSNCAAATTGNITLVSTQTIDGVSVTTGKRVLVRAQNTGSQNGVYIVGSSAWTRAIELSSGFSVSTLTRYYVDAGTDYSGSIWHVASTGIVGTDTLTFST